MTLLGLIPNGLLVLMKKKSTFPFPLIQQPELNNNQNVSTNTPDLFSMKTQTSISYSNKFL